MKSINYQKLVDTYNAHLFDNVLPFWLDNSIDNEYGGYMTWLDRDGTLLSTDKPVWMQGRGLWVFSRIYNEFKKDDIYLEAARKGYEFLRDCCYDTDGRMFFRMSREGKPLRKRRYVFSDVFAAAGFAEYYRATGEAEALELARKSFNVVLKAFSEPGYIKPKFVSDNFDYQAHSPAMIIIDLCKTMRLVDDSHDYDKIILDSCNKVVNEFYKPELHCLLENITSEGEYDNSRPEGRLINPGHATESAWFILDEAINKGYGDLTEKALKILDDSLEMGWDKEYGGLFYFLDSEGKQPFNLEWDMKLWWPHNEALIALLMAKIHTNDKKYDIWFEKVYNWSMEYFLDKEYGEWFGYLHRDGSLSQTVKGSIWKGTFHVPRFYMKSLEILNKSI